MTVATVHEDPRLSRPPNGITLPGAADGRWLIAYATMTGTEVLDWVATVLGHPDAAQNPNNGTAHENAPARCGREIAINEARRVQRHADGIPARTLP